MPKVAAFQKNDPHFVNGIAAGYDASANRWRNKEGQSVSRNVAVSENKTDIKGLGNTLDFDKLGMNRLSSAAEKLERAIGGLGNGPIDQIIQNNLRPPDADKNILPIPGSVLTSYRLADFYYRTEGDLASIIETPIQLAMRDINVFSDSTEIKNLIEEMYDVDKLDMQTMLRDMWLSLGVYSIAHPWEQYEGPNLKGLILLPPAYTWLGDHMGSAGAFMVSDKDQTNAKKSLERLAPSQYYRSYLNTLESKPNGSFDIPANTLYSVRGLDLRWVLYPKPWIQGAFRALSTRLIYEEMRRSIYEGFKHQLWAFLLGDKDKVPSAEMVKALTALVDGMAGERTASLVFWGGLRIEVFAPKTDQVMSSDEWQILNLEVFRRLGFNMRAATGNSAQNERGGAGFEVDVDLLLEKMNFMRSELLKWERGFRLRWAKKLKPNDEKFIAEIRKSKVEFSVTPLELRKQIKDMLLPLYTIGALSPQTLLTKAGMSFETEKTNKEANKASGADELFGPPPTFAQTTVNDSTPESSTAANDAGRPKGQAKKPSKPKVAATQEETDVQIQTPEAPLAPVAPGVNPLEIFSKGMEAGIQMAKMAGSQGTNNDDKLLAAIREVNTQDTQTAQIFAALVEKLQQAPVVNIANHLPASPDVTVNVPATPAPVVNANITVEAPEPTVVNNQIDVPPAQVVVQAAAAPDAPQIVVNVPAQAAPNVTVNNHVEPTPIEVKVDAPEQAAPVIQNTVNPPEMQAHIDATIPMAPLPTEFDNKENNSDV